jgi:(1->4)-alpha-D-glucan 1-alpha-D-glucosylmutase
MGMHHRQIVERALERAQLLLTLENEGLLPPGTSLHQTDFPGMTAELAAAVYAYLARTPSKLLLIQAEDAFGVREQPNVPGLVEPAYPCWRLKLPLELEDWSDSAWLQTLLAVLRRERATLRALDFMGSETAVGAKA